MKDYNEQEFNKLCAEFFEWEFVYKKGYVNGYSTIINNFIGSEYVPIIHLKFHSDWNWIMEVVEKIEHIKKYSIGIDSHPSYGTSVLIQHAHINGVYDLVIKESTHWNKKEAVVEAIWQFLNWYNEQKQ